MMSYSKAMKTRWLGIVALCAASALGPAQDRRDVELEEMENVDPPRANPAPIPTPPYIELHRDGAFTIRQVNVNASGQNILNDAANEPSITLDPNNPSRMAIGWRQFDSVTSNFRQAGFAYSADGGQTWTKGTIDAGTFRSDPVLDTLANGTFHYNSLQQTFYSDEFNSTNFGASWTFLNQATGGDKQWIVIDRTGGIGDGNIYQIWSTSGNNYSGRQFSRSTNGGSTWMNPINIPNQPIWGTLDYASDGTLYVGGSNGGSTFYCSRSSNARDKTVTPSFDLATTISLGGSVGYSTTINPEGLAGQSYLVVDRSSGPTAGNVYMLSSVRRGTNDPMDVMFSRSTNKGANWSTAKRINDDATGGGKWHWMASLSCAPNGRLDAIWLDTRNSTGNTTSQLYRSYSLDGGVTWAANEVVSTSFSQGVGYPQQNKMGDYMNAVSRNDGAHVAFCGTFTGGEDVYYVFLPAPQILVSGTVTLGSLSSSPLGISVGIVVVDAGTGSTLQTTSAVLGAGGAMSFALDPNLTNRSVRILVDGPTWLRKTSAPVTVGLSGKTGMAWTLINGDSYHDNQVDASDYFILSDAYDTVTGDSAYDLRADLNRDGVVDATDYFILSDAYELFGD